MAIAAIVALPVAICAAAATYVTYGLATCFGFDAAKTVDSYFPQVLLRSVRWSASKKGPARGTPGRSVRRRTKPNWLVSTR